MAAADEVNHLQRSSDPEGQLFNKIAEQGHYAGRTYPTDTRQGTYAFTTSGVFLASVNSGSPDDIAAMLTKALSRWNSLSKSERLMSRDPNQLTPRVQRAESKYPVDGLVLHEYSRDLGRKNPPKDWRADAWNQDFAWFRKEEARRFVPSTLRVGEQSQVPERLAKRLVASHLIDNVRGQVPAFQPGEVEKAEITSKVIGKEGNRWVVQFSGNTSAVANGAWPIAGDHDFRPSKQSRGVRTSIVGKGVFDPEAGRFVKFEMASVGTRFGATQYNGRADDLSPAPIGFYFTLAGNTPAEQIAPANFWAYGW